MTPPLAYWDQQEGKTCGRGAPEIRMRPKKDLHRFRTRASCIGERGSCEASAPHGSPLSLGVEALDTDSAKRRKTISTNNTTKPEESLTTTATTSGPAPATAMATLNSTAGQAPAPQASQAPSAVPATPAITGVASGSNTGTKVALQTSYVALMAGLEALYQPGDVLQLSTGNETRDELIADFQQFVQAAENTKASYQAWRGDVQTERQVLQDVNPKRGAVRTLMESRFGKGGTQLLQLCFVPRKPAKTTVEAKAQGVVKGEATRKARGTKGKKQKLGVTGNVTGVILTPVTSSQNVAPPAPAPVAAAPAVAPAATTPPVKPAGS
jgi:hypothetical protein